MTRVAGLAGARGENLCRIADAAPGGAEVAVIVTDRDDAAVLDAADARDVPTAVVRDDGGDGRDHERRLLDVLSDHGADLVCLDGYERTLTDEFLSNAPTTLAVHPSLLPAFPDPDPHRRVLDAGVAVTGCTVHVVTETGSRNPIVTQEPVPVYGDDSPDSIETRVREDAEFRAYPRAVRWFADGRVTVRRTEDGPAVEVDGDGGGDFPARRYASDDLWSSLRYGENPHQDAAVYADATVEEANVVAAKRLDAGAKGLSYNNYNDADAALGVVREFDAPAAAVIKHTNPAGCAVGDSVADAYARALSTDPMSAFGGIVALNRTCDAATAEQVVQSFKEVVVAPDYTDDALHVLSGKETLRVLAVGELGAPTERFVESPLTGGRLVQERDLQHLTPDDLTVVTERAPTDEQVESLLFSWQVVKHVTSNAIVFADGTETVGIGAGQMSRVDAVRIAAMKADEHAEGKSADGTVMASDAFFPFPDGVEVAAEAGVEAVVQPGGSKNDDAVTEAADDLGLAMVHTGQRAFRHD